MPDRSTPTRTEEIAPFARRHIGPQPGEIETMLATLGYEDLDALLTAAVPASVIDLHEPALPPAIDEDALIRELRGIAAENRLVTSMLGLGYHDSVLPAAVRRNVLENPAWYTSYTPYQAEIAQGRLQALLIFQTLVSELTGLEIANASLLDEPTAAVEAMLLCRRARGGDRFLVDTECLPQTIAVLETRAAPLGIELVVAELSAQLPTGPFFGALGQYPRASGEVCDLRPIADAVHARGALLAVASDPLALVLLRPPGKDGADIVLGTAQRFGMPLGFGGPHAGFFATGLEHIRSLPGRLVSRSVDRAGHPALQLALQAREQHIRRERATSNICTAEVLPAVISAMYAVWHGPDGLRSIAEQVHGRAVDLASRVVAAGAEVSHDSFFDTVEVIVPGRAEETVAEALACGINIRLVDADRVAVSCDETTTSDDIERLAGCIAGAKQAGASGARFALGDDLLRRDTILSNPVFHEYRSETAFTRYLRRLSDRDLALDRTMIPLGSCTMKLNAAAEMEPISWPELSGLHPFAPAEQTVGTRRMIADLEGWLAELTGYDAVSLQPNAGSQGELAGLLAIRALHLARGETDRTVCLVPSSAHGTNPASAQLAGFEVVVVACTDSGEIDRGDLERKLGEHRGRVGALMVTYPSTSGVYEAAIGEICSLVHDAGAQVYLDGANLNALIGVARLADLGADASHLNLHKTFCIPHGGGGPGVGPIAVRAHLAPYLPSHPFSADPARRSGIGPVSGAPYGSPGILPICWAYLRLLGGPGLAKATRVAVLNANYLAHRLRPSFPVLYTGPDGLVAHECVLDLRPFEKTAGIGPDDVAKRLIDYGFHAPTMSFPVPGTLMVEPTESENLAELDRFCAAMIEIRNEIALVEQGAWPREDNPLVGAPHTAEELAGDWGHCYSRQVAAFPLERLRAENGWNKYFSPVKRLDLVHGDRNPSCTCAPVEAYANLGGTP